MKYIEKKKEIINNILFFLFLKIQMKNVTSSDLNCENWKGKDDFSNLQKSTTKANNYIPKT